MIRVFKRAGVFLSVTIVVWLIAAATAWPGGDAGDHDHHDEDEGPRYFGFVKDTSGKTVADARVAVEFKGRAAMITRTDGKGAYRIPGLGKNIEPTQVTISCSKPGYKQIRTLVRTPLGKKPLTALEIECYLQRTAAK